MKDYLQRYNGKTITVTGSSGYLGSVIVQHLKETSANILRISRKSIKPIRGIETFIADIRDESCWDHIVLNSDIIFHLSANTCVYSANQNIAENLDSSLKPITHLINVARKKGICPTIVFASTATVYGMTSKLPVTESEKLSPITIYDLHKLFAEQQLKYATRKGIINAVSLRLANVYGPSLSASANLRRGVLNKIIRMALEDKKIYVFGSGDYIRDYVYVDDVAKAFVLAGFEEKMHGLALNIASGKGISIYDVFNKVKERVEIKIGGEVEIETTEGPKDIDPIETRSFVADISRISSFGWSPKVNLNAGIDKMINSLIKNHNELEKL